MEYKNNIILSSIVLFCVLFLLLGMCYPNRVYSETKNLEKVDMKVKFYAPDRENKSKGKFLGIAEIKEGELEVDVTDSKLKELLTEPLTTMKSGSKGGMEFFGKEKLQPGTPEHLRAVIMKAWKEYRIIGEIVKE